MMTSHPSADLPTIPLTFRGTVEETLSFTQRAGFRIRFPRQDGRGIPVTMWPFGRAFEIEASMDDSSVLGGWTSEWEEGVPLDRAALEALVCDRLDVQLALGDATRVERSEIEDGRAIEYSVATSARSATSWHALAGKDLLVGVDADGFLARLVWRVESVAPTRRRIRFALERGGSASAYGTAGFSIAADAPPDPSTMSPEELQRMFQPADSDGAACPVIDVLHSGDGATSIMLSPDARFVQIDGPVTEEGDVDDVPEAVAADECTVELDWPTTVSSRVQLVDDEHARVSVRFADRPALRWISLGGSIHLGVGNEDELVELRATDATHVPQDFGMGMGPDGDPSLMEPEAMMAFHAQEMERQFEKEFERARKFAAAPTHEVFALADPPDIPCQLEPIDSPWSQDQMAGVTLRWHDESLLFDPERYAEYALSPHVEVSTSTQPSMEPPDWGSSSAQWVAGQDQGREQMQRHLDGSEEQPTPREMQQMHDRHQQHAARLDAGAQTEHVVVDGEKVEARVIRGQYAISATARIGDLFVSVNCVNVAGDLPEIVAASTSELAPLVDAFEASRRRHLEMMRTAQHAGSEADAPEAAKLIRRDSERLLHQLQSMGPWGQASATGTELFAPSVVDQYGGVEAFDERLAIYTRALGNLNGRVDATDHDGTVVHLTIMISLPRPDGGAFGMSVSMGAPPWWEHDAQQVREMARRQLDRSDMGEYELEISVLAARQADGSLRIEDDLLALIDEIGGGLESLLPQAQRPPSAD